MSGIEHICNICVDVNLLRFDSSYVYFSVLFMCSWLVVPVGCLNVSMMPENMANIVDQTRLVKVIVLFFVILGNCMIYDMATARYLTWQLHNI